MKLGMVIDLKRCFGCYACQLACKAENLTPPGVFFARCLKGEIGNYPTVTRQALPILCMQCDEPECEKVCPTQATIKQENGVVTIDKDKCIGCRYCVVACPYGARNFVEEWKSYFPEGKLPEPLEPTSNPFDEYAKEKWTSKYGKGTIAKCDFCMHRIEKGLQPACVDVCPAKARFFGDLDDPESEVSLLIKKERGFQLNPELGTNPAVYYLPQR